MKMNCKKELLYIMLCISLIVLFSPQIAMASTVNNNLKKNNSNVTSTPITISFDANGGAVKTTSKNVLFRNPHGTLPIATRKNYQFDGWYMFKSGGIKITEDSIVGLNKPYTLYAHWNGDPCEVKLDTNGGTLSNTNITMYYSSKYLLPTPTRKNYIFKGWYTKLNNGNLITTKSIFDENSVKTLYAQWEEKTLKVKFVAYNGDEYSKDITCGKKVGDLPKPKKAGFTFGGWYSWNEYSSKDAIALTKQSIVNESTPLNYFARWYKK